MTEKGIFDKPVSDMTPEEARSALNSVLKGRYGIINGDYSVDNWYYLPSGVVRANMAYLEALSNRIVEFDGQVDVTEVYES